MEIISTNNYLLLINKRAFTDYYYNKETDNIEKVTNKQESNICGYYPLNDSAKKIENLPLLPDPYLDKNIEDIEIEYYDKLFKRKEKAKEFKGQVAGKHPDLLTVPELNCKLEGFMEGYLKAKSEFIPFKFTPIVETVTKGTNEFDFYEEDILVTKENNKGQIELIGNYKYKKVS